mmetsp:Transcript_26961/g.60303  ORF Transcript_26961/g.60303 Transcript_26961/m.60303 type:complete len:205 (+) Transcript_26961:485-1099(+)
MRPFHVGQPLGARHHVECDPYTAHHVALDVPVGRVVVPRRGGHRARLLDEELVVEHVRGARAHGPRRQGADLGAEHPLLKHAVPVPQELVVVEAAARALRRGVLVAERAGRAQVLLGGVAHRFYPPGARDLPEHDGAVVVELPDGGVREVGCVDARQRRKGGEGEGGCGGMVSTMPVDRQRRSDGGSLPHGVDFSRRASVMVTL